MNRVLFSTISLAATILLSSCSCAIRSESWVPVGGACDRSVVESCAVAVGFRPDEDLLKKQDSYLRIEDDARQITLQSSWCPFPHHLIFAKAGIRNWEQRTDTIRDEFLQETRKRGIHLRNDQL